MSAKDVVAGALNLSLNTFDFLPVITDDDLSKDINRQVHEFSDPIVDLAASTGLPQANMVNLGSIFSGITKVAKAFIDPKLGAALVGSSLVYSAAKSVDTGKLPTGKEIRQDISNFSPSYLVARTANNFTSALSGGVSNTYNNVTNAIANDYNSGKSSTTKLFSSIYDKVGDVVSNIPQNPNLVPFGAGAITGGAIATGIEEYFKAHPFAGAVNQTTTTPIDPMPVTPTAPTAPTATKQTKKKKKAKSKPKKKKKFKKKVVKKKKKR